MKEAGESDPKELAAQLRKPEGELGLKVANMLNSTNQHITKFAYDNMDLKAGDHVLEIGFGNGLLMPQLLSKGVKVTGVDFSEDMVKVASSLLAAHLKEGNIALHQASVSSMPFPADHFDSVCTINTLYFWPDPLADAREILRILKPGAALIIAIRPKVEAERFPTSQFGFQLYQDEEALNLLKEAGFKNTCIIKQQDPEITFDGKQALLTSMIVKGIKP